MSKRTVAIIGAVHDSAKWAHKSVLAHLAKGFEVYPVHPSGGETAGLKVYASLADLPGGKLDRVSLYLRPALGLQMLSEIAARGCDELWLNPGTESEELVEAAQKLGLNTIEACSIVSG
jgi:predicted CoA-binding protein